MIFSYRTIWDGRLVFEDFFVPHHSEPQQVNAFCPQMHVIWWQAQVWETLSLRITQFFLTDRGHCFLLLWWVAVVCTRAWPLHKVFFILHFCPIYPLMQVKKLILERGNQLAIHKLRRSWISGVVLKKNPTHRGIWSRSKAHINPAPQPMDVTLSLRNREF